MAGFLDDIKGAVGDLPSVKDLFNGYVQIESAKVNSRLQGTAAQQSAGLNSPGSYQNPQAKADSATATPGAGLMGVNAKPILIGLGALGLLLAGLKVAKVI